jgi:hypothetical protein
MTPQHKNANKEQTMFKLLRFGRPAVVAAAPLGEGGLEAAGGSISPSMPMWAATGEAVNRRVSLFRQTATQCGDKACARHNRRGVGSTS